jgi:hypothetical protein
MKNSYKAMFRHNLSAGAQNRPLMGAPADTDSFYKDGAIHEHGMRYVCGKIHWIWHASGIVICFMHISTRGAPSGNPHNK